LAVIKTYNFFEDDLFVQAYIFFCYTFIDW